MTVNLSGGGPDRRCCIDVASAKHLLVLPSAGANEVISYGKARWCVAMLGVATRNSQLVDDEREVGAIKIWRFGYKKRLAPLEVVDASAGIWQEYLESSDISYYNLEFFGWDTSRGTGTWLGLQTYVELGKNLRNRDRQLCHRIQIPPAQSRSSGRWVNYRKHCTPQQQVPLKWVL
jgi:hypothetical protein